MKRKKFGIQILPNQIHNLSAVDLSNDSSDNRDAVLQIECISMIK